MNVPLQIPVASSYSFTSQTTMPSFPSVPLPSWSRLRSNSTAKSLQPVEYINEKDGFGLPAIDDPDPFGVLALEREGFEIKEAGTLRRPSSEAFEYKPSPTSPIFNGLGRRSSEGLSRRSSRRDSKLSVISLDRGTQTTDLGISTIDEVPREEQKHSPATKATEDLASIQDEEDGDDLMEEEPEVIIEEPHAAVHIVAQKMNSPAMSRAKLVTIPKRIPPTLPQRSPLRKDRPQPITIDSASDIGSNDTQEQGMSSRSSSPMKNGFYGEMVGEIGNPWGQATPGLDGANGTKSPSVKDHHESDDKALNENEEFHSMPSTPIEISTPYPR